MKKQRGNVRFAARRLWAGLLVALAATAPHAEQRAEPMDAYDLVAGALDLVRGDESSYQEMSMTVHRPDWERSSSMVSWSRGREDALMRFTAPAKDAGNALLKQGEKMWTYTPKLNRTIRLPYSMRSQSWAGSDFSYDDLSRADNLLQHYALRIAETREEDGHAIYTVEAIPHDDAPVVWGKEIWVIRDDYVMLEQAFYDQGMEELKRMTTLEIREIGDRVVPTRMRMEKLDEADHWTEIVITSAEFDIELPDRTFTVFALKSGAS